MKTRIRITKAVDKNDNALSEVDALIEKDETYVKICSKIDAFINKDQTMLEYVPK